MTPNTLKQQLEIARFDRALEVSESLAKHRALLTAVELARLNNLLLGKKPEDTDGWRTEPATIRLASGKEEHFSLLQDPKNAAREKLHHSTELAENGHLIDSAVNIYVGLVLAHAFKDANRRTAVLAAHYFLKRYGVEVSGLEFHELGAGDLRDPVEVEKLKKALEQLAAKK